MQLSELRVFVVAAEELNFSRTAERLHLSQSAVSQNIQSLERVFAVELFTRQGRSVRLSEAGQALLPLALEVVNAVSRMSEAMNRIEGQVAGELVIGCSTTSGKYLLPNLVAAFRQDYPLVRLGIKVMSRDEVINRLMDGRLGLGVTSQKVDQRDLDYVPFFEDRVILIVPAQHPWAAYGRALPADLVDEPMILREAKAGTMQVLLEGLAPHGITLDMLNPIMEIGNAEAIEMAVEENLGIAFVSELAAARGLALGRVAQVEVPGLDLRRTIYIARNARVPLSRTQDRFWSFVAQRHDEFTSVIRRKMSGLMAAP
ncbi:MAG: LysR family transcriptional regulator [Thermoflexales bacterium]|nr:LysR family transcriptional regulator [Thermoflexales bacterium]